MVRRGLATGFFLLLVLIVAMPPADAQAPRRGGVLRIAERRPPTSTRICR